MRAIEFFFFLPTAFVFDLGLVGIFLYFVTQNQKISSLPWPKIVNRVRTPLEPKKPKIIYLLLQLVAFGLLLYAFLRYQTIFFVLKFKTLESLLNPEASIFYSLMFLFILVCQVISYAVRFFKNSYWVLFTKNAIVLLLFYVIWNEPVEATFEDVSRVDVIGFLLLLTGLTVLQFVKSLLRLRRRNVDEK